MASTSMLGQWDMQTYGCLCADFLSCRLFLIEGVVAVIVSGSFFFMPKNIDAIKSLTLEEREALHASMMHHAKPVTNIKQLLLGAIKNPAVWLAGAGIKFMRDIAFYGAHKQD